MPVISQWSFPYAPPYSCKTLWLLIACLLVVVWWFDASGWDVAVERFFYAPNGEWLIAKENSTLRWLMYFGPKYLIIAFGVGLLAALVLTVRANTTFDRRAVVFVLVCIVLVPALAATLKHITGIYCPYNLSLFDGSNTYKGIWGFSFVDGSKGGICFPAGHPSGGFALIALAYVVKHKRSALSFALAVGSVMSFYQMARGAHFMSHCAATLLLSILVIDCVYRVLRANAPSEDYDAYLAG